MDPHSPKQKQTGQKSKIPSYSQFTFLNFSFSSPLTQDFSDRNKNEEAERKKEKMTTIRNKEAIQLDSLNRKQSQIIKQVKKEENSVGELKAKQDELSSKIQNEVNMKQGNGQQNNKFNNGQNLSSKEIEQKNITQITQNSLHLQSVNQHIFSSPISEKQLKGIQLNQPSPDTMRGEMHAVGNWLLSFRKDWKTVNSGIKQSNLYINLKKKAEQVHTQFYEPLKRLYQCLPLALTETKYEIIYGISFHNRLLLLSSLSVLWGTTSIYLKSYLGPKLLQVTTRSLMAFIIGGIILLPEIYYPFLQLEMQSLKINEKKSRIQNLL